MKTIFSAAHALSALAEIGRGLEKSAVFDQVKDLRGNAAELQLLLRLSGFGRDLLNRAGELKLRAERKLGEILTQLHLRGGDHKSTRAGGTLRFGRLGISYKQSAAWQLEALLPEVDFASYLQRIVTEGKEPSSRGLQRLAKMYVESATLPGNGADRFSRVARGLRSLADEGRRFACIYIDESWAPVSNPRANGFRIDPRLARLPVMEVAAPRAHLYLKATPESRDDGVRVLGAWGFSWKASLGRVEVSLDPYLLWQPVCDLWLLGVRDESGCDLHGLPPWI